MVKTCSAINCHQRDDINSRNEGISFHRFPKEDKLRKLWALATKRQGKKKGTLWKPNLFTYLCSKHFIDSDFEAGVQTRRRLQFNAIPSIFDFPYGVTAANNLRGFIEKPLIRKTEYTPMIDHSYCIPEDEASHLEKQFLKYENEIYQLERKLNFDENRTSNAAYAVSLLLEDLDEESFFLVNNS